MNKVFAIFTLENGSKKLSTIVLLKEINTQYGEEYAEVADTLKIGEEMSLYPLRSDLHLKRIYDLPNDLRNFK